MGCLVLRVRRGLRQAVGESDIVERLTLAARELVRLPSAAAILASSIYRLKRRVTSIALALDDPEGFLKELF